MATSEELTSTAPSAVGVDLIEARDISRTFGAVRALRGVSLSFRRGEVHGLVGANGAGKSTFLNIVGGAITPSGGELLVDGKEVTIERPKDADDLGFAFIHQELALVPDFSAIDNMTLGLRTSSRLGLANLRQRARVAGEVAERIGATFSLRRPVRELSPAERGLVAIGRALVKDARFIAMDEPTAALSDVECERLFRIIRELAQSGVAVAYVSHRLGEIEELSDRVTVFRDGQVTGRFERDGYDRSDLIRGITGGEGSLAPRVATSAVDTAAPVMFRAEHLSDGNRVRDMTFEVRAGEVLGIAGVVGAGRSETFGLVYGSGRPTGGSMTLVGKAHRPRSVREAVRSGVALVPEERRSQALLMGDTIRSNVTLGNWRAMRLHARNPLVSDRKSTRMTADMVEALSIKTKGTEVAVRTLSGGNQQKVVFGRWMAKGSRLLLLDEPTRGVDVGARQQIWRSVEDLAAAGNAVIVVSSELEELAVCHRVVVVVEGRTVAELHGPGVSEEEMLSAIYSHTKELQS